jgi:hypothetical protein
VVYFDSQRAGHTRARRPPLEEPMVGIGGVGIRGGVRVSANCDRVASQPRARCGPNCADRGLLSPRRRVLMRRIDADRLRFLARLGWPLSLRPSATTGSGRARAAFGHVRRQGGLTPFKSPSARRGDRCRSRRSRARWLAAPGKLERRKLARRCGQVARRDLRTRRARAAGFGGTRSVAGPLRLGLGPSSGAPVIALRRASLARRLVVVWNCWAHSRRAAVTPPT